jgi:hypothetical protein
MGLRLLRHRIGSTPVLRSRSEMDIVLYPCLQAARGNKAAVAVVCGIEAVKAMGKCFLLHICCELGNEQSVFDGNVSGGERLGHGWNEVQEPKAYVVNLLM